MSPVLLYSLRNEKNQSLGHLNEVLKVTQLAHGNASIPTRPLPSPLSTLICLHWDKALVLCYQAVTSGQDLGPMPWFQAVPLLSLNVYAEPISGWVGDLPMEMLPAEPALASHIGVETEGN